jgi:hypothetical protein
LRIKRCIGAPAVLLTIASAIVLGGCQSSQSTDTGNATSAPAGTGAQGTTPGAAAPPEVRSAIQSDVEAARAQRTKAANENGMALKKAMEQNGR